MTPLWRASAPASSSAPCPGFMSSPSGLLALCCLPWFTLWFLSSGSFSSLRSFLSCLSREVMRPRRQDPSAAPGARLSQQQALLQRSSLRALASSVCLLTSQTPQGSVWGPPPEAVSGSTWKPHPGSSLPLGDHSCPCSAVQFLRAVVLSRCLVA